MKNTWVVAITGASGMVYARRVLEILNRQNCRIHLTVSRAAAEVIQQELATSIDLGNEESVRLALGFLSAENITYYDYEDITAPIASGSFPVDGMLIIPCSMGTVGSIASGISGNLIERAADVALKEKRPLILLPRETPLNIIHLDNLLKLARAGATILPAMPAFYHHPQKLEDLIDFVAFKVVSQMGIRLPEADRYQYQKITENTEPE
ncbi:MAG: flavin prenyltransferase UbiX [Planctomycetota bacterium]|mgnify:CR=1 FL=1